MNFLPRWVSGAGMVLISAIFFSSKAIMIKLAYRYGIDAVSLLGLRMAFAMPFFAVAAWVSRPPEGAPRPDRRTYISLTVTALLGYYFASLFDFIGLQYITAGLERLILFSYPTLVVLIMWLVYRKSITSLQVWALLLTYGGMFTVWAEDLQAGNPGEVIQGSLWILACSICYAWYLVGSGRLIPVLGAVRFTSLAMVIATSCVILHAGLLRGGSLFGYPWQVYGYAFMMALFATVIPAFMLSAGIRRIGASTGAIISSVGPVSTIVLAWIFLGETLTWLQIVGTAVVLGGVALITARES